MRVQMVVTQTFTSIFIASTSCSFIIHFLPTKLYTTTHNQQTNYSLNHKHSMKIELLFVPENNITNVIFLMNFW